MTLLIVEDNDRMRRLIRSLVSELTPAVYECSDGARALDAYTRYKPDWVLMDLKMEELDGIDATRQIKAAFPEARILIVTDYDDPQLREAARAAGASGYLLKENLVQLRQLLRLPPESSPI